MLLEARAVAVPSIYILSSERSGTNLLRSLLSNHPLYEGPIPIHFFDVFYNHAERYGDLRQATAIQQLLTDAIRIANHPYHDWQLQISANDLWQQYKPTDLFTAFQALYGAWCAQQGKQGMICKDNNLFHYAFYIRAHDPSAKFIYLYRDVRAYCASWKGVPAMHKTTYQNARHWVAEQKTCLNLMEIHGIDCVPIAYETLVADTPASIDSIFSHIGMESNPACYQTASGKHDAAAERNEFWKNINKPIFDRGAEDYRKKLNVDEIAMIEAVAGAVMDRLGYTKKAATTWQKPKLFSLQEKLRKKQLKKVVFTGDTLLQEKAELVRHVQYGYHT